MSQENWKKIIAQQATTIQNLTDEIKLLREQVFRPITSDFTARSALLLDNSKLPSSKTCLKVS